MNGNVYALAASGGNIYIGGTFTTVRRCDPQELGRGQRHQWRADHQGSPTRFARTKRCAALAVYGSDLYVGGAFTTPRRYAAKVNAGTGALNTAWAPVISNSLGTSPEVRTIAVNASGTRVILGGFFNRLNSGAPGDPNATNLGVGAVDSTTGASLPWAWHTSDLQTFRQFQLLHVRAGRLDAVRRRHRQRRGGHVLEHRDRALNYVAGFNGNVTGLGVTDGVLYIGGHYSDYCGPIPGSNFVCAGIPGSAARDKLTAVDAATGQPLYPWAPSVNTNLGIEALDASNNRVAIGGEFTRVAGVNVAHFARFAQ